MTSHIQVALPLPVDRTFTYRIPEDQLDRARPGCRAVVPLGRRVMTGIIVGDSDEDYPPELIRDVLDLPDAEPLLPPDILDLTSWISKYYFCSWGEALKAASPAGLLLHGNHVARLTTEGSQKNFRPENTEKEILHILRLKTSITQSALARKHRIPNPLLHLRKLQDRGLVELQEMSPRTQWVQRTQELVFPAEALTSFEIEQKAEKLNHQAPRQARILRLVASEPKKWSASDLCREAGAGRPSLNSLIKTGILRSETVTVKRYPTLEALTERDEAPLPEPNHEQHSAIEAIISGLITGRSQTFLLYGVTGSGKTLVYQRVIERALESAGTALVLIPEIALTPQLVGRFRAHFGDRIGLQHSAMSSGERTDVWRGIRAGEFPIVIGARSAVFAPLANLKLVIVDEEGDPSFKQNEPNPRYHARDVALVRAKNAGAVTVLGSATPSIESFFNAARGRFKLLELPHRVDQAPLPSIRFCEPAKSRVKVLGSVLERAITERFQRGDQTILLQNRRGYFTYAICSKCGYFLRCTHCEVALTLHTAGVAKPELRCHLCGYKSAPSQNCSQCGGPLRYLGTGTQRVERELAKLLPEEKVVRLDLDTTSRKGAHHRILKGFAEEQQAILLGTKMVARGHDYPRVTLVGVVNADTELAFPDFRCDERAFVLLLQAAGRAGRLAKKEAPGEVLIQTWMPSHPVLKLLKAGNYRAFYDREIELRRILNYPPWGWMVLFGFTSKKVDRAQKTAQNFIRSARHILPEVEWLGPTPAYRSRLKDRHRFQVILKAPRKARSLQSEVQTRLRNYLEQFKTEKLRGVQFSIDVDPIQML